MILGPQRGALHKWRHRWDNGRRVDDALDCLTGSEWFTVLDLRSGYYQIPVAEEDQEKTAFICPLGFYQFQRMPQGVSGAPATFQRLMEKVVGDMNLLQVLVYLDDLIVFGRTLEEHEERLLKVLDRLEEAGLKLCAPAEAIPTAYAFPISLKGDQMELLSREDIEVAQENDMVIRAAKQALNTSNWPSELTPELGLMKW
ncbi:hypothetical protein SRHO_G00010080 [Serrasalmus rhombeus]